MGEFRGIYPAIITPMRRDGEIDEAAFREVMEYNIRAGVHGFWVAGGTGESILLTEDENGRIAEAAADQNRGRVKNIMHVGAATTAQTIRQAERAARAGVEAICAVPPFFYNGSDDDVVEYYRAVGAATDLPLFIYNLPSATGVEITTDLADKIQERVPQLAGLKHSAPNFWNIVHFVNMGLDCFTGSGMLMVSALSLGAAGTIDGPPCAAPEPWVEAWDAYHAGDIKAAEAAQSRASEMYPPLLAAGYLPAIKALVGERLGIDCGSPRPPASQVTPEILEVARAEARRLGPVQVPVGYPDMTNPPLSVPVKAGLDVLNRLGLTAESSMTDSLDEIEDYSDVLISAHAPATIGELRLNIAATDDVFRRESIDHIAAFVDRASRFPNVRQVNIHFAPRRWVDDTQTRGQRGDYERLIDGVREIATFADDRGIEIVMENATAKWTDVDDDVPAGAVDWSDRNIYFGTAPEEWIRVCEDVDRPNVGLCLDSSHVCTYAQTFADHSRRNEVVMAYVARPELIRHVHWSDNYLYDPRGRNDSHLSVGKGTMPTELHRAIKRLHATLLLEHFYTEEELEEELAYIEGL